MARIERRKKSKRPTALKKRARPKISPKQTSPDSRFDQAPIAMWEQDLSRAYQHIETLKPVQRGLGFADYMHTHPEFVASCLGLGMVTAVNQAALLTFGVEREEFLRYGLNTLFGENYTDFSSILLAMAEGRQRMEHDFTVSTCAGTRMRVLLSWTVLTPTEKPYARMFVSAIDMTERYDEQLARVRHEEQLRQVEKLESMGLLAGRIAHDFNNILMAIIGYATIVKDTYDDDSVPGAIARQIETAAVRAADLTGQLVVYSGKSQPILKDLDLSTLIRELEPALLERNLLRAIVRVELCSEPLPVRADAAQVRQLMFALVENAVEAIGAKPGLISIRTGSMTCGADYLKTLYGCDSAIEGTYAFLEVTDTGCGMDTATHAQLFVPFFTTKSHGRGLGLTAVLGIMKGHKGGIAVTTDAGEWSTFRLLFPLRVGQASGSGTVQEEPDTWSPQGTILVIDDEAMIRDILRYMLQQIGFKVLEGSDGASGLECFAAHASEISAVLLDVVMPGMSSEETLQGIHRLNRAVPVILSSGSPEDVARERFRAVEVAGYIHKPYKQRELERALRKVLRGNV